jgi:sporulation protein YlmC with PRC-barrel domain
LREYRETNGKLYGDITDLEVDIKDKEDFTKKLRKQRNDNQSETFE